MIDIKEMEKDFIERRKLYNKELKLNQSGYYTNRIGNIEKCEPHRLKEKPFNENPQLLTIIYKNGKGAVVLDMDNFQKLPKYQQNKIFALGEVIE